MTIHTMRQTGRGWQVGMRLKDGHERYFEEIAEGLTSREALLLVNFLNGGNASEGEVDYLNDLIFT